jgi:hypothetical protein
MTTTYELPAHAIGILNQLGIPENILLDAIANDIHPCPICHASEPCRFDAFPLAEGKCCPSCSLWVSYAKKYDGFHDAVKKNIQILKNLPRDRMEAGEGVELPAEVGDGFEHKVILGIVAKFHTVPEKHYLQYACGIVSCFKSIGSFIKDRTLGANDAIFSDDCDAKSKRNVIGSFSSALMASLSTEDSVGLPTFIMGVNGTISSTLIMKFRDEDEYTGGIIKLNYFSEKPMFVLKTVAKDPPSIGEYPVRFHLNEGGRCDSVVFTDGREPIEIVDELWLQQLAHKIKKQAKKEQERKEQERKERKEREREEMRLHAIKQREEEIALRVARATLVSATAVVDTQLETIRKLRELNREVALKNQKLADRKEADRLAKEAEKRHAEKLKQKELERQKFISKKQ